MFLDRDGVLCVEKGYITNTDQLEIFPYTKKSIERIQENGFLAICITNQSAVGRGLMTEQELKKIHEYLIAETGLDALYYCPHHPEGYGIYKCICNCRKPKVGMLKKAAEDYKIDLSSSYMIGDRASDILCGKSAGVRTILLESGYGTRYLEQNVDPDLIYTDLWEFVQHLRR